MIRPFLTAAAVIAAFPLGGCIMSGLYGNDEFERYSQRADVITLSAGDAKEVNRVTHTNHPWPRYVADRRIPVSGDRMARAIDCYRSGPAATRPTTSTSTQVNFGAGTAQSTSQTSTRC